MAIPLLAAILPFLGKAAAGLLAGGKAIGGAALSAGKTILPNILSSAASSLLGGGQGGDEQTGPSDIIQQPQQPAQPAQQLFQYQQPPSYLQAIKDMLKTQRGF